ncbi:MAG: ROK family protein [Actinomycetia bacterium]|nr:ROK family protein [Actinomycetes bacterium]
MTVDFALGIDVGGTKIAAGLVDGRGRIRNDKRVATPVGLGAYAVIDAIISCAREVIGKTPRSDVVGVGLGVPSQVDFDRQEVEFSELIPFVGTDVRTLVSSELGLTVTMDNDANLAALGERRFGAAREVDDFIMLTLGTGVGSGLFLAGQLYRGAHGLAGEIGHTTIDLRGPGCLCGGSGHFETLFQEAQTPAERALVLAAGLANLINTFNPRLIIIGGGIGNGDHRLVHDAAQRATQQSMAGRKHLQIIPTTLGDDAGVLGGAALAFAEADERERFVR